ncbi:glycosyltransferase [Flavobacterium sp. PL12]|uniref:glycosyltransferase n=1 Tax=Flavobacterium sp. PL12 TaxID=3071718 RepID=UPI00319EA3D1
MKFLIVTHVPHILEERSYFAYAPYIDEMNIWAKQVSEVIIIAPLKTANKTAVDSTYRDPKVKFLAIEIFDVLSLRAVFRALIKLPRISCKIFKAMQRADHIHLRCPGNIGLLGCFVQIVFPNKKKTAKYAGNWDPKSKQPWSYRLQKWILSNTFLTRNMQVLVYGEWKNQSKNIKPFFTATYLESEKKDFQEKSLSQNIHFIFVGTLVKGKNPMYAIQLVHELVKSGYSVYLDVYGEGVERASLEKYILDFNLAEAVNLKGNQSKDILKKAYQESHFVILPSKSEGWPKAIAEGMFWGCVPIATPVSCVPFMVDFGNRGVLLQMNIDQDVSQLKVLLNNESDFVTKARMAAAWSKKYTVDLFETEIKKMILS